MNFLAYFYAHDLRGVLIAAVIVGLLIWLLFYVLPLPRPVRTILAVVVAVLIILWLLPGCSSMAEYNSHVAARENSITGYSKDGNTGGSFTHRVEYR